MFLPVVCALYAEEGLEVDPVHIELVCFNPHPTRRLGATQTNVHFLRHCHRELYSPHPSRRPSSTQHICSVCHERPLLFPASPSPLFRRYCLFAYTPEFLLP